MVSLGRVLGTFPLGTRTHTDGVQGPMSRKKDDINQLESVIQGCNQR